ncbi:VOC family protein [Desmospora activa]|uniref:VOC domain-containing protein n=1 Tax=Desmospora activa DSM 45169 TaxID=1121389 RepID=A0A2T4ZCN9_9BACL|nr:VOC family protein [Desmospora activa]PTM59651.1 hypothetical protein C8J48_2280 [Desmospora activa DSM 45169]
MGLQAEKIFVNLPVKDLKRSVDFFTKLGFEFNDQFSGDKATCMVISENIYAMLLVEDFFQSFTKKELTDTRKSAEIIVTLSAESREQVDEIVNRGLAAGGKPGYEFDHGFMYESSFQDIDGHFWAFIYMDESKMHDK